MNGVRRLRWVIVFMGLGAALALGTEAIWDRSLFARRPDRACANLNATAARAWLRYHPETQVLDVRSAREVAGGTLPGAVNISIGDAEFQTKVARLDRNKPVLVYCEGGFRSRKAVGRLKSLGFTNIQHLHRGYLSWRFTQAPAPEAPAKPGRSGEASGAGP